MRLSRPALDMALSGAIYSSLAKNNGAAGAMPQNGRCIIFDLDGTLIDSRRDIASAVNMMRKGLGLGPLPLETVVSCVGNGAKALVERALAGEPPSLLPRAHELMKESYRANLVVETSLYPGVSGGLRALKSSGWSLAVISNKPAEFCREILARLDVGAFFACVIGGGPEFPLKPEPDALLHVLAETASKPESSWVMGDNYTDLESGRRASMRTCYASYGFGDPKGSPYDLKVASFMEFVSTLGEKQ